MILGRRAELSQGKTVRMRKVTLAGNRGVQDAWYQRR